MGGVLLLMVLPLGLSDQLLTLIHNLSQLLNEGRGLLGATARGSFAPKGVASIFSQNCRGAAYQSENDATLILNDCLIRDLCVTLVSNAWLSFQLLLLMLASRKTTAHVAISSVILSFNMRKELLLKMLLSCHRGILLLCGFFLMADLVIDPLY